MSWDTNRIQGLHKNHLKGIEGAFAGAITGSIEVRVTFPVEYVKIQLELDGEGKTRKFNGMLDVVRHTIARHGFFGLYRGIRLMSYAAPAKSALRFGVYEQTKQYLQNEKGTLTPTRTMLCGLTAGVVEGILVVTPSETLKVKFINDRSLEKPKYKGLLHGIRDIYKEYGLSGLYRGATPTVARQGINQAIRFYMMERLKEGYQSGGDTSKHVPKYMIATFGAFSGACSCYATSPLDVVKTRMQSLHDCKFGSALACFTEIWKKEGFYSFYKGSVPRLCRHTIDVAISFTIYDTLKELMDYLWIKYAR